MYFFQSLENSSSNGVSSVLLVTYTQTQTFRCHNFSDGHFDTVYSAPRQLGTEQKWLKNELAPDIPQFSKTTI